METKIKLGIALGVFLGLILFTEFTRSESATVETDPETTVNYEYEKPEAEYAYSADTNEILKTFFPEGKISKHNLIGWKPDLEEKLSMCLSEDGLCYTKLDTIITIDIYNQLDLYIFSTASYLKDLKTINRHYTPDYSYALVEANGKNIKSIRKFIKKPVSFNYVAKFTGQELIQVGPDKKALKIVTKNELDSVETYETTLIDVETLKPLLQYESLKSNEMVLDDPYNINLGLNKKEVELTTQTGINGLYDIILNQKETTFDSYSEKLITRYTTKVYRWNQNMELELCYD